MLNTNNIFMWWVWWWMFVCVRETRICNCRQGLPTQKLTLFRFLFFLSLCHCVTHSRTELKKKHIPTKKPTALHCNSNIAAACFDCFPDLITHLTQSYECTCKHLLYDNMEGKLTQQVKKSRLHQHTLLSSILLFFQSAERFRLWILKDGVRRPSPWPVSATTPVSWAHAEHKGVCMWGIKLMNISRITHWQWPFTSSWTILNSGPLHPTHVLSLPISLVEQKHLPEYINRKGIYACCLSHWFPRVCNTWSTRNTEVAYHHHRQQPRQQQQSPTVLLGLLWTIPTLRSNPSSSPLIFFRKWKSTLLCPWVFSRENKRWCRTTMKQQSARLF